MDIPPNSKKKGNAVQVQPYEFVRQAVINFPPAEAPFVDGVIGLINIIESNPISFAGDGYAGNVRLSTEELLALPGAFDFLPALRDALITKHPQGGPPQ